MTDRDRTDEELAEGIRRRGVLLPHVITEDLTDEAYEEMVDRQNDNVEEDAPRLDTRPLRRSGRMIIGGVDTDPNEILRFLGLPTEDDEA